MSAKGDREKRRQERETAERQIGSDDRRGRLLQIAAGTVFLVVIAIVVVVVVASHGSSGGDPGNVEEAAADALVGKLPQQGLTLGRRRAPVELIEYGDLQCPYCKEFSETVLPQVIEGPVAAGMAKVTFRNFLIIGPQSLPAGAAAIAAGE